MADEEQQNILKSGADAWNHWREENPGVRPSLAGVDLHDAVLDRADFSEAIISGADLCGAHLHHANFQRAVR